MKAAPPSGIQDNPTARPLQNRLRSSALLYLGAVTIGVGLLWALSARAPIAIRFDGIDSSGVHLNPYGRFTIRNLTQRTIDWSVVIEAPSDPISSPARCSVRLPAQAGSNRARRPRFAPWWPGSGECRFARL